MMHRLRAVFAGIAFLLSCIPQVVTGEEISAPAEFAAVESYIKKGIADGRTPSVAVAVVRDGKLVWAAGYGQADIKRKIPATSNSIYRLASISKPMTATGLMVLKDRGLIDLDAPANRYLPGTKLRSHVGSADEMTIRRIANHTSGLPIHYNFFYHDAPPPSMDDTLRWYGWATKKPGAEWEYSNLGFGILNYVTEVVGKQPWGTFMEQKVYDSLGMDRTSHRIRPGHKADAAVQYNFDLAGRFYKVPNYEFDHPGASVICSSARDMMRFARMHMNGGELEGRRILSKKTTAEMQVQTSRRGGSDSGMGVAWAISRVRGHKTVSHTGGMPGVSTALRLYPEQNSATIVLLNSPRRSMTTEITNRLAAILLPKVAAKPDDEKPPKEATPDDPKKPFWPSKWNGKLVHAEGDIPVTLKIDKDGKVTVKLADRPEVSGGNINLTPTRLRFEVTDMLRTQSAFEGTPKIEFRLRPDGKTLKGPAIAFASGYFALAHWLELSRAE